MTAFYISVSTLIQMNHLLSQYTYVVAPNLVPARKNFGGCMSLHCVSAQGSVLCVA